MRGGCIQCSKGQCREAYHASCAMLNGNYMRLDADTKDVSYCETHSIVPTFRVMLYFKWARIGCSFILSSLSGGAEVDGVRGLCV